MGRIKCKYSPIHPFQEEIKRGIYNCIIYFEYKLKENTYVY